jgi:predicted metal-dependent hydrolase
MTLDWTQGALQEGLRLYRSGRFFATHEAWESVWLTAPPPEKLFLQGLIQVTVALHHFHRHNHLGATRLLTAALRKLSTYAPTFATLDVALLCDDIRASLKRLAADPPPTHLAPPRIQMQCL